ncbi:hypothetical protein ACTFIW_003602 [Dictyostelium discoideum]
MNFVEQMINFVVNLIQVEGCCTFSCPIAINNVAINLNSGYCYHHSIQGNFESCKKSLVIPPLENNVLGCKVCSIPKNICVDDHIDQTYQKLVKIDQSCYKYLYSNYHCKLSIKDCNVNHTTLSTIDEEKDLDTCDYLACANVYYTYDKCNQNRPCKLHPNFNKYSYRFYDGNFYKDPRVIQLDSMNEQEEVSVIKDYGISGDSLISCGIFSKTAENLFKIKQLDKESFNLISKYINIPNFNQKGLKFGKILDIKQVEVFDSDIISISTLDTSSIKCSHGQVLLMVDQLHKTDSQLRIEVKKLNTIQAKKKFL